MRGLCPIIKDMARAVNLANDDRDAMKKIIAIDQKAIAHRENKAMKENIKER